VISRSGAVITTDCYTHLIYQCKNQERKGYRTGVVYHLYHRWLNTMETMAMSIAGGRTCMLHQL